jgi:hypothetical protein
LYIFFIVHPYQCLKIKINKNRTKENMKNIAFEMAKNYQQTFSTFKNSQVNLKQHEEATQGKK